MPAMLMSHAADPREEILSKVSNFDDLVLFGNWVLVGIYVRPNITKSGIHLADQTVNEDRMQGKAALVLKLGPTAFKDDAHYTFSGLKCEVGDWVTVFVSDGRKLTLVDPKTGQKLDCRLVEDQHIRLKLSSPDSVW